MAANKAASRTKERAQAAKLGQGKLASVNSGKTRKGSKRPPKSSTKGDLIRGLLRRRNGASVEELAEATGWQAHSVRGFLSGTINKKLRLNVRVEKTADGVSRYRLDA